MILSAKSKIVGEEEKHDLRIYEDTQNAIFQILYQLLGREMARIDPFGVHWRIGLCIWIILVGNLKKRAP